MKRTLLLPILLASLNCSSSLTICDQALKTRLDSRKATGEQKDILESKAAGLEQACEQERARQFEQMKKNNERVNRR